MKIISHRGNLEGKKSELENTPMQIYKALEAGFDVEVDVWRLEKKWFLGHDFPQWETSIMAFPPTKIWWHAKNLEGLQMLVEMPEMNVFWHDTDKRTLTSKKYIWTYPEEITSESSIIVLREKQVPDFSIHFQARILHGICTDFPIAHKEYSLLKQGTIDTDD